ncbi:MAG: S1 RNA-binding domain-containing protein [Lachnospiraceae bacterium]|nr:S1 RNA-binding domain-containing protein [Lachnospiraceae bacterium]
MFNLGGTQTLIVDHFADAGAFLKESGGTETVLLPGKQVPEGTDVGSLLTVFLYKDSEDRLIATTQMPRLQLGETALLTVKQTSPIGAFLDWGLAKDLFLPFKETKGEVRPGQKVLVTLYIDKSRRLAATMRVDRLLRADSPYKAGDKVAGTVYAVKEEIGAFVAVDGQYFGLIPRQELYERLKPGDAVETRVMRVREDGKLDLSPRKKAYAQMEPDAEVILAHLAEAGGILGIGDKSDAELIRTELSLSKNAFKRAAGRLLKEGKIRVYDDHIEAADCQP